MCFLRLGSFRGSPLSPPPRFASTRLLLSLSWLKSKREDGVVRTTPGTQKESWRKKDWWYKKEGVSKVKLKQRTRRRRGFPLSTGDVCRYGEPCRMQRRQSMEDREGRGGGEEDGCPRPPNPPTASTTPSSFPYLCQPFIPDPRNSRSGGHNARMHHHPRRPSLSPSFSLLLTLSSSNLSLNKARSERLSILIPAHPTSYYRRRSNRPRGITTLYSNCRQNCKGKAILYALHLTTMCRMSLASCTRPCRVKIYVFRSFSRAPGQKRYETKIAMYIDVQGDS